ncbi:MAG TPA: type II toxin-antitoxin system VapC family toxin [Terriglobales bacterium]|nr:type II toxin-antitoxin system VapC family toxin [Terriglobales bacterium]
MRYLLDTGVWLWSVFEPQRLSAKAHDVFADLDQEVFLSAASAWEIAIKSGSGKLRLPEPPTTYVPRRMTEQGVRPLAVSHQHALAVWNLPRHHRDPFDRLLIAQASLENMVLISSDRIFERYSVQLLWAGG